MENGSNIHKACFIESRMRKLHKKMHNGLLEGRPRPEAGLPVYSNQFETDADRPVSSYVTLIAIGGDRVSIMFVQD